MNLQTFLSKIWAAIKKLFTGLPADLQLAAHVGVSITQNIKYVVDSPLADIITAIIPGDIDDKIKVWLRLQLPVILSQLKLSDSNPSAAPAQIVISAIKTFQNLADDIQHAFAHNIGILVAQEVAKSTGKSLSWTDAVYVIEWYYQNKVKHAD